MHFVIRWCHSRKCYWKSFSGIPLSKVVTLRWKSLMFSKSFLPRNSRILTELCAGTLLRLKNPLVRPNSPPLLQNCFLHPCQYFQITPLIHRLSLRNEILMNYLPCDRRNTQAWSWSASETCIFPLHPLAICFRIVLKTECFVTGNDPINILYIL
jgi:hypothetical protein